VRARSAAPCFFGGWVLGAVRAVAHLKGGGGGGGRVAGGVGKDARGGGGGGWLEARVAGAAGERSGSGRSAYVARQRRPDAGARNGKAARCALTGAVGGKSHMRARRRGGVGGRARARGAPGARRHRGGAGLAARRALAVRAGGRPWQPSLCGLCSSAPGV
jgi:hypothetical protein